MEKTAIIVLPLLIGVLPAVLATHDEGCVLTRADPSTVHLLDAPDGRRYYIEDRNDVLGGSGTLLPTSVWVWEEMNGIDAVDGSLQRGGLGCIPSDEPWNLLFDNACSGPNDQSCGHGPDRMVL